MTRGVKRGRAAAAAVLAAAALAAAVGGACGSGGKQRPIVDAAAEVASCPAPTSGPTTHASGTLADMTFSADASPHLVTVDSNVTGTLTIEPCAEVLLGPGRTLTVIGVLDAAGAPGRTIHIGAATAGQPFARIRTLNGTIRLAYVTIDGGGDPGNTLPHLTGTLDLQGSDAAAPTQPVLFVDHVTIAGSASTGVVLRDGAGFAPGSSDLTITGSALYPANIWSRASGTLPSGRYTGNGADEILLPGTTGNEGVAEDARLAARGVPYRVGHDAANAVLRVAAPLGRPMATLTIEPGVTLRFTRGAMLQVAQETPPAGSLVAVGTAEAPVVFTSAAAAPAAGDWLGIYYGTNVAPTDRIDHARVEHAGGASSSGGSACPGPTGMRNEAAIRIFGPPASQFVTNTTIRSSAGHGIDRGWRGDAVTDFLPTNTFEDIAWCRQSTPRAANGVCPAPDAVPCPR